jgi:hypothetical protein
LATRQQDAVLARLAAQANVGAQADHRPVSSAARVRFAQAHDISDVDLDKFGRTHGLWASDQ